MAYGDRGRPVVTLTDRAALLAWRPAEPAVIVEATRLKEQALLTLGMTHSAVASWLYSKCHHQIPTTAIDTAAVVASGDGVCLLLYNPGFFVAIGLSGVEFVLFHEARHLIQRHLFAEPELHEDPVFTAACEVSINHVARVRLDRGLPEIDGRPVGVDPVAVHGDYERDLREQGLTPLAYGEFIATDQSVHAELGRMRRPPVSYPVCVHVLDQETVDRVGGEVLAAVLVAARRGNEQARQELLDLLGRTEGGGERVDRLWGGLGAHMLRGTTTRTRRVEWWQRWLSDVLGSLLRDGERLIYPKKRGAVLAALGHDPMLARRGRERTKVVVIAVDTSGSMPDAVIEWLTRLVGRIDGVRAHWLSFDGRVMPFRPGERVYGGGGTDFGKVRDYVEKELEHRPDAVIVLTDGHAAPITPAEPDRWIWLITEGGDDWPDRRHPRMACHRVREP